MNNDYNNDYNYDNNYSNPAPEHSEPKKQNVLSKISKILAIVGLITSFCNGPIISIAAVVLASISRSKVGYFEPDAQTGKSLGIAGIVIGAVALVIIYIFAFMIGFLGAL